MTNPAIRVLWRGNAPGLLKPDALARALATSPIWEQMGSGFLVLRRAPTPTIAAMGYFDEADIARLEFLSRWLDTALTSIRYIDYPEVNGAVMTIANRMRDAYGDELKTFDYAAIPRGGLIVLGLLSYALGLDGEPGRPSEDTSRPLVVVDDCSLTGSRFRRFIDAHADRQRIIFVHLCSTPQLRAAILAQEPRVSDSIAAVDLHDLAPARFGDGYPEWRDGVEARVGTGRYWVGQTEEVGFPWSEPDHNFWNPVTQETEWGWTILPPEMCLKNAVRTAASVPVIGFDPRPGEYAVGENVLAAFRDDQIWMVDAATGSALTLDGAGADIWQALADGLGETEIADLLTDRYDVSVEQAAGDVRAVVDRLASAGMVVRDGAFTY